MHSSSAQPAVFSSMPASREFRHLFPCACVWLLCLFRITEAYGSLAGSACTFNTWCVNATVQNEIVTYQLTSFTEDVGWMALGFGENMVRTHIVILWQNEDGSMTLSQRYAPFYAEPVVIQDPPRIATVTKPLLTTWHPKKSTTFAFHVPANPALLNGTRLGEELIWALSPLRPAKDYLSHISRHSEIGQLTLDFQDTGVENKPDSNRPVLGGSDPTESTSEAGKHEQNHEGHETTVHTHAFLLSFGFLVLLPFGVLAGRWGRTISPLWIKAHWIFNMAMAGPVIGLGWVLGPVAVYQHGGSHLNDPHKVCGVILVFMYAGQVLLGRYVHKRVQPALLVPKPHPPLNILHAVIGALVIVAAFLQVRSGLDKLQLEAGEAFFARWYHKVWAIWAAVIAFLYFAGLTLLPRQWHQEREYATRGSDSDYVPLSDHNIGPSESFSTRLLFENPDLDDNDADFKDVGRKHARGIAGR